MMQIACWAVPFHFVLRDELFMRACIHLLSGSFIHLLIHLNIHPAVCSAIHDVIHKASVMHPFAH